LHFCVSDCDIALFPQIVNTAADYTGEGVMVTGPLAPNTPVTYACMDDTMFFINGVTSNMCNGIGTYANAAAPTCERSKLLGYHYQASLKLHILKNQIRYRDVNF